MADTVICGQCGARNSAGIEWCGQCFAALAGEAGPGPTAPTAVEPAAAAHSPVPGPAVEVPTRITDVEAPSVAKPGTWVCTVCDTANPLEDQQCSACGTSIFTVFGAEEEEQKEVDPQRALLRSIMFPGLGHAIAGQGLLGSAIGGLTLMALGFGIALAATQAGSFGWPLLLLALGIWVAAAFDAFRIASGGTDIIFLRPRVVTALVGLVMSVVVLAAFLRGRA